MAAGAFRLTTHLPGWVALVRKGGVALEGFMTTNEERRASRGRSGRARHYLAVDLGAESGRLMLGTLERGRLSLEEVHRFSNVPLRRGGSLTWDFAGLLEGIRDGLRRVGGRQRVVDGLSVTAWGVDYVLFNRQDRVMAPVFHYRDARTQRGMKRVHRSAGPAEIFAGSGIQFMPLNTIYQLAAETGLECEVHGPDWLREKGILKAAKKAAREQRRKERGG